MANLLEVLPYNLRDLAQPIWTWEDVRRSGVAACLRDLIYEVVIAANLRRINFADHLYAVLVNWFRSIHSFDEFLISYLDFLSHGAGAGAVSGFIWRA
jgi:hypothetical protein